MMEKAGVLYQILGDEKYGIYVRDMLAGVCQIVSNIAFASANPFLCKRKVFLANIK